MLRGSILIWSLMFVVVCAAQTKTTMMMEEIDRIIVVVDDVPVNIGGYARKPERNKETTKDLLWNLQSEVTNLNQLISDMHDEMRTMIKTRKAKGTFDKEVMLWTRARDQHCVSGTYDLNFEQTVNHYECKRWIGECRLRDLLVRYDELYEDQ